MLSFISNNIGTITVSIILFTILLLIIMKIIKDKKHGKSSCGCGCSSCALSELCRKKEKK